MPRPASPPRRLGSRAPRRARFSLTPLIDVVFILLVFFMLASSFAEWRTIRLGAVESGGGAPSSVGAMLVEIGPAGLRLAGAPIDIETLEARIAERLAERPDQRVLVRPFDGVEVQATVEAVDRLAAAGARDISFLSAATR
ncbi:MAG: biopolymer transporter ExbD [Pseudomonadota bacterium]